MTEAAVNRGVRTEREGRRGRGEERRGGSVEEIKSIETEVEAGV